MNNTYLVFLFFLLLLILILIYKKEKFTNNYNIYLYWENKPNSQRHPYLDLCLKSIKKHNNNIVLLTPDNLTNYIDKNKINPKIWKLKKIAQRADYIRYKILNENGGMWLDFDTICLNNLTFLFTYLNDYDMVFGGECFFACKKGCLNNFVKELDNKIEKSKNLYFKWTDFGIKPLEKHMKKLIVYKIKNERLKPKIVYNYKVNKDVLNENLKVDGFLNKGQLIVKMYNNLYNDNFKNQLFNNKNNLFNKLINK